VWLSRVQRGSAGCGVAQEVAVWFRSLQRGSERVRRGPERVRRGPVGCSVAQKGMAWLGRVRRGSGGCSVAHQGVVWLSRVWLGSVGAAGGFSRVRHCSAGCGVAQ
jgi:hypothetical protein